MLLSFDGSFVKGDSDFRSEVLVVAFFRLAWDSNISKGKDGGVVNMQSSDVGPGAACLVGSDSSGGSEMESGTFGGIGFDGSVGAEVLNDFMQLL